MSKLWEKLQAAEKREAKRKKEVSETAKKVPPAPSKEEVLKKQGGLLVNKETVKKAVLNQARSVTEKRRLSSYSMSRDREVIVRPKVIHVPEPRGVRSGFFTAVIFVLILFIGYLIVVSKQQSAKVRRLTKQFEIFQTLNGQNRGYIGAMTSEVSGLQERQRDINSQIGRFEQKASTLNTVTDRVRKLERAQSDVADKVERLMKKVY